MIQLSSWALLLLFRLAAVFLVVTIEYRFVPRAMLVVLVDILVSIFVLVVYIEILANEMHLDWMMVLFRL